MSTKRFTNVDGTNTPETGAWSIQETAANPGEAASTKVFHTYSPDLNTPANVRTWTVQSPATGSDQNLTESKGPLS